MLGHYPDLADVRCGVVNPEIITEFPNKLLSVLRGAGFNVHTQELAGPNVRHL